MHCRVHDLLFARFLYREFLDDTALPGDQNAVG